MISKTYFAYLLLSVIEIQAFESFPTTNSVPYHIAFVNEQNGPPPNLLLVPSHIHLDCIECTMK